MAGIYIHIPFCKQACNYCNFHFTTSLRHKNDFIRALLKEMEARAGYLAGAPVETVYFGGGTPSLLDKEDLDLILTRLRTIFDITPDAEFTLEVNPDDILPVSQPNPATPAGNPATPAGNPATPAGSHVPGSALSSEDQADAGKQKLAAWKAAGINRLSMGVQSFFEEDLAWMHRAHDAGQAIRSIHLVREFGFENFSIDLIYGSPTLSDEHWRMNVEKAVSLGIPHLSCYALTVEPKTPLDKLIRQHKKADIDPDTQATQFLMLMDILKRSGYEHYEISNFALPGKRSRHNSSYWQGKPYLGLGPSAHSFDGDSRQWNIANNARYIAAWTGSQQQAMSQEKGQEALIEKEILTPVQQINEYIMISLRTMEGIDLQLIEKNFSPQLAARLSKLSVEHIVGGKMIQQGTRLQLTQAGKLLADGIAASLFLDETPD